MRWPANGGHAVTASMFQSLSAESARPADWKFSSYQALVGRRPSGFLELQTILRLFAFDPDEARRQIEEFVCPPDMAL